MEQELTQSEYDEIFFAAQRCESNAATNYAILESKMNYAELARQAERYIALVKAGLITVNEARKFVGLQPIPGGDTLRTPSVE